jgi:hypothetical protein
MNVREEWLPWLEAMADDRVGGLPAGQLPAEVRELGEEEGGAVRVAPGHRPEILAALERAVISRPVEWAGRSLTYGEVLAGFARHCETELDEVEVLSADPTRLQVAWRRERAGLELRAGCVAMDRLAAEEPLLLLCPIGEACIDQLVGDQRLAARLAICDLVRLEKINTVRSSVFVYFEWFLRDAYGVKLLTASDFTRALVARGILSLGMG